MSMNLKNFFDLNKVVFTKSELELPYEEPIIKKEEIMRSRMNKQEVINKLRDVIPYCGAVYDDDDTFVDGIEYAISVVQCLNEPERPSVPQFVADWYEDNEGDFEFNLYTLCLDYNNCEVDKKLSDWFCDKHNKPLETLVNMHQFGYEVEKEKLYTARLKLISFKRYSYINRKKDEKRLFISDLDELTDVYQTHFTQAELEELDVWNNSAFEIKEVEE